jgi:glycosyltransferase involved in cell wall biosynthesis
MRVALLSPLPPERTGIANYAAQWMQALREAGVEVICPLQGQKVPDSLASARRWVAERQWSGVDVVHAELGGGRDGEFYVMQALAEMNTPRLVLSATVHDPERIVWRPVSAAWRALDRLRILPSVVSKIAAVLIDPHTLWHERRLASRLDGVVTLTRTGGDALASRMRLQPGAVTVIPLGVVPVPPKPLPPKLPIKLLYFGYIYSGKGIEDLVDALGELFRQRPELVGCVSLTIAGGTAPDVAFGGGRSYLDELRERVNQQGLQNAVQWELDVDEAFIAPLIQSHHLMVLPYRESRKLSLLGQMRGTSSALAWAIACGRAAVTSDARAFAEEISQGNGLAFPQGDVKQLCQALNTLLTEEGRLEACTAAAAEAALARQWSHVGEAFATHFKRMVAARTAPGGLKPQRRPA